MTEAVRDATIGGRKVKRGQTIALDPDDGLVAVEAATATRRCWRPSRRSRPGFELLTLFYGDGADLAEAEAMARRIGAIAHRRGGRGPPRRPAVLPLPDRRRVGVAKATSPAPRRRPTRSSCSRPRWHSPAWPPAPSLRRAGIRLGFYTVRDLLFHLPRRYDDLREMRKLGDLRCVEDGTVVSAQARVGDVRVEPGFRGRIQRTIARLEDETGSIDATWFGRRFIERRLQVGGEIVVSGKIKHFGRR